jgi:prephenate dehydratase
MRVAYAGAAGAFAHSACLAFTPDHVPVAVDGFAGVADAVERGEADIGMLPVRNSRAGPVAQVAELLAARPLAVVAEHSLPVRMHLLALPGSALSRIRVVISHPVALAQCAEHLRRLGLDTLDAPNTALAARGLTHPHEAVLASEAAAGAYGLAILCRDMHDDPDNATVFAKVALRGAPAPSALPHSATLL